MYYQSCSFTFFCIEIYGSHNNGLNPKDQKALSNSIFNASQLEHKPYNTLYIINKCPSKGPNSGSVCIHIFSDVLAHR